MTASSTPPRAPQPAAAVLTIGQLAAHVGVTVRAIRHYHQRGLLAEPIRDPSGYRRYDAQAVADLIRIKTLATAGVPLGRIRELLDSDPTEFAEAVAEIDRGLQRRIGELERLRRELATLRPGERLVLPAEVVELLDQMGSLGVSERTLRVERDGWTLLTALAPAQVPEWAAHKSAALADPDFRRLYLAWEEADGWDPEDPRLVELAAESSAWLAKSPPSPPPPQTDDGLSAVHSLLTAQLETASPAWRRLDELCRGHLKPAGPSSASASGE
ncbi:MAG: MerR family transcriptional regulator [Acidimicrobiales bacterium]